MSIRQIRLLIINENCYLQIVNKILNEICNYIETNNSGQEFLKKKLQRFVNHISLFMVSFYAPQIRFVIYVYVDKPVGTGQAFCETRKFSTFMSAHQGIVYQLEKKKDTNQKQIKRFYKITTLLY